MSFPKLMLLLSLLFTVTAAQAGEVWQCGSNQLENLKIYTQNQRLVGAVGWAYDGGGAIDGRTAYVHRVFSRERTGVVDTLYFDGPTVSASSFALIIYGVNTQPNQSVAGYLIAHGSAQGSSPFRGPVTCVLVAPPENFPAACADPNSAEGSILWNEGKCGPQPGGSN
jgi:hypothetical protein